MLTDATYQTQATFHYALRRFMHVSEENARAAGVTPTQYLLLLAVRGHPFYPHVAIGEIAEHLQISPHSASLLVERAIKRLVDDQPAPLVVRVQDVADRRVHLVSLTPAGEEILTHIMTENRRVLTAFDGIFHDMRVSLAARITLSPPPGQHKRATR